jgi:hypothetical protein
MELSQTEWVVAATFFAVWVLVALGLWIVLVLRGRLLRCPETGGAAFVDVANGQPAAIHVRRCDLWPGKQACARGCLVRYPETL